MYRYRISLSFSSSFMGAIVLFAIRHGPHQVAQKSTNNTFPLNLLMIEVNKSSLLTLASTWLMVQPVFFLLASSCASSSSLAAVSISRYAAGMAATVAFCSSVSGVKFLIPRQRVTLRAISKKIPLSLPQALANSPLRSTFLEAICTYWLDKTACGTFNILISSSDTQLAGTFRASS